MGITVLRHLLFGYDDFIIAYFVVMNSLYFVMYLISLFTIRKRMAFSRYGREQFHSHFAQPISLLVPAYNEQASIVQSVRSLLLLEYPQHEVIVVNDGSKDATLQALIDAYALSVTREQVPGRLPSMPIRGIYRSARYPSLVVVDKENGGKADALNASINVSSYPLVCAIDADSIIEQDALLKLSWPFYYDSERMIAAGGTVRIANDSVIDAGRLKVLHLPRKWIVRIQVVEYLRSFLLGRVGTNQMGMLLIISGAFGLFKKEAVVEVGGYQRNSIGEDMELVVRLHHHYRKHRIPYKMEFVSDAVCWTEAPEDIMTLRKQRNRWHRGMIDSLRSHAVMFLNPRYGVIGLAAFPFFVIFELFGPVVELIGYIVCPLACVFGYINAPMFVLFLLVAVLYSMLLSFSAVLVDEICFHRYAKVSEVLYEFAASVLENIGYRQAASLWRLMAFFDYFRGNHAWGEMARKGFTEGTSKTM